MAKPLNDVAAAHLTAGYTVHVRPMHGVLVGEVRLGEHVVWTSPMTAREERARELAQEHIGALCGLRDGARH